MTHVQVVVVIGVQIVSYTGEHTSSVIMSHLDTSTVLQRVSGTLSMTVLHFSMVDSWLQTVSSTGEQISSVIS